MEASWYAARRSPTRFDGCKLTSANFEELAHLGLVDAKLFRGAVISLNQAAGLLAEWGITVA